jgi:hypothetical protein
MPEYIPARIVDSLTADHVITFGEGILTAYGRQDTQRSTPMGYDVQCPGCGRLTYRLSARQYPMVMGPWGLTCRRPLTFERCCGWMGNLSNGRWIGR